MKLQYLNKIFFAYNEMEWTKHYCQFIKSISQHSFYNIYFLFFTKRNHKIFFKDYLKEWICKPKPPFLHITVN